MDRTLVCRDAELQQLDGLLTQALGGAGRVCLVTGEAGAGKTSLTTGFARRANVPAESIREVGELANVGVTAPARSSASAKAVL